jgi:hypothetical protein
MSIYDRDGDGFLSQSEMTQAAPRFRAYINERLRARLDLLLQESNPLIRNFIMSTVGTMGIFSDLVFYYIAHRGRIPSPGDLHDFLSLVSSYWRGALPSLSRLEVLKVMEVLKETSLNQPLSEADPGCH